MPKNVQDEITYRFPCYNGCTVGVCGLDKLCHLTLEISYPCCARLVKGDSDWKHYSDVIVSAIASLIIGALLVYPTVCSGEDHYCTLVVSLPIPCWGCRVVSNDMAIPFDAYAHEISFCSHFSLIVNQKISVVKMVGNCIFSINA